MSKVFLGGTCNESTWRNELEPLLQVDLFNPVVEDWTDERQRIEEIEKSDRCNIHLYVITSLMTGTFSIAEVIESAMTRGKITILQVISEGFENGQLKSLREVMSMAIKHGAIAYEDSDIHRTARVINNCFSA